MRCKDYASLRSKRNDLARAVNSLERNSEANPANNGSAAFRVTVEGEPRDLNSILRDEIYRIAVKHFGTHFITPRRGRLRLKSAMTMNNSDCISGTMERAWIQPSWRNRRGPDTTACRA